MNTKTLKAKKSFNRKDSNQETNNIGREIINTINELKPGLQAYPIRTLVEHAEQFGPFLRKQRLETNQIRKFLDAINRLKAKITLGDETKTDEESKSLKSDAEIFAEIETEIVLLKPKLAYAAARQRAAKPLSEVMSVAIDKVHSLKDFERLVQFIESIIAYHKAEGGR